MTEPSRSKRDADAALICSITDFVTEHMSRHDPSHNATHVKRVAALAHRLLETEARNTAAATPPYDETVVTLAALLHDVADHKYTETGDNNAPDSNPATAIRDILVSKGADRPLAERVQTIVSHVSYTTEIQDPARIQALLNDHKYRELAIVQDADRLDALGAVGIARCFTFLGARGSKTGSSGAGNTWDLQQAIDHFGDKLEKLESIMKTQAGRAMARVRTQRLREFRTWWEEELEGIGFPGNSYNIYSAGGT